MSNRMGILCIGEVLWDALPSGLYLGGAPLNVCFHLNQLGVPADIAGRVGDDRLGNEAVRRIKQKGISTEYIQRDKAHETGFVSVELGNSGDPAYDIVEPAAWDGIEMTDSLGKRSKECRGVVFGSLAQRSHISKQTIQKLWETDLKKILDINLRQPYVDRQVIRDSLTAADIVKMNQDELDELRGWHGLSSDMPMAAAQLAEKFDCSMVCITQGVNGAGLFYNGNWHEHRGFRVTQKDAVGAGDAFLAALLHGLHTGREADELLVFANAAGALVASRFGATPEYAFSDVEEVVTWGERQDISL